MMKKESLNLSLVVLILGTQISVFAADALPSAPQAATTSQDASHFMLTGVASIGEKRFVSVVDAASSETIQLTTGSIHPSGLELVEVVDTAFGGSRVRVRRNGVEWWLNFAAAATLATQATLMQITGGAQAPAPVAPAQNLGTFSNDTLSKRFDTPSSKRKAMARYPLPPGI